MNKTEISRTVKRASERVKMDPLRCVNCQKPLNNFIAYVSTKGGVCLKCFAEYAQAKNKL